MESQPAAEGPSLARSARPLGGTGLYLSQLGLGCGALGNLYQPVSDSDAAAVIDRAFAAGIGYLDTAPFYGLGLSEARVGRSLRTKGHRGFTVSTKAGRLLRPGGPGSQPLLADGTPVFPGAPALRPVFDFSYDGIVRSLAESLDRLGLDHVDLLYMHDPEDHVEQALDGGMRALLKLREEGTVRAIGAGSGDAGVLARLAAGGQLDVVLVAGRYTLLEQGALRDLLPLCSRTGTSVVIGGVFNSGILSGAPGSQTYDYAPAPPAVLARVARLSAICAAHGVRLASAALQFPLAHPVVASVLTGVRSTAELDSNLAALNAPVPDSLWAALRATGLIAKDAPVPGTGGGELPAMRIDAHQHFWRYTAEEHGWMDPGRHRPLRRDFLPADLAAQAAPHRIDAVVSVQARQSPRETDFLLGLAHDVPGLVVAVVGWTDLRAPHVSDQLDLAKTNPLVKGLRHFVSLDPDRQLMRCPSFIRGLRAAAERGLVFDLLVSADQLPGAAELAAGSGMPRMVLDHMGNPPIGDPEGMSRWRTALASLSAIPGTYCKISGYPTLGAGRLRAPDLRAAVEWTLQLFGPRRAMWGSDWPVCTTDATYSETIQVMEELLGQLSADEQAAVMGGTAADFYSIRPSA